MAIALFLLITRSTGAGQQSTLSKALNSYIERNAEAMSAPSSYDLVKIIDPQGAFGDNREPFSLQTLQNNAVISTTTRYADIIDDNDRVVEKDEIVKYEVQEGENLSLIAQDFGVSLQTIIWANNIKNVDQIKPGTILKIPPVTGVIHKVSSGDTVSKIAQRYKAQSEDIISFNHLSEDGTDLRIGQEIIVPHGVIPANTTNTNATVKISRFSQLPNLGGYFIKPATGYNWGIIHGRNGIDVANSCGTPIYAAANGTVVRAKSSGYNGGFGKFIMLSHPNGTETLYAHLSKLLVDSGTVTQGQQIGVMGTTGRSTGCHLHFEVHGAKNPLSK